MGLSRGVLALTAIAALLKGTAEASCAAPANAVEAENCLPGQPLSVWNVPGAGDPSLQGFATRISVNKGETVEFKVKTDAAIYRLDIYRVGYYGGNGARSVAAVTPSAALPQSQPECLQDASTGLIDCGNWAVSASWTVPGDAVSGIYFARLVRADTQGASHVVFVVRDDGGRADVLFQTADPTWQAYNAYGGNSLYVGPGMPLGRAFKVSYNRPFITRQDNSSFLFTHEYPMVRWLEANGYDVAYAAGADVDERADLPRNHRVFLSVGHDEYWSKGQRDHIEAARNAGVHMMFLSGNGAYWKTRWESSVADGTPRRTLVCYKETYDGPIDPSPEWTGTWRDGEHSPPGDGGRPENALTGTLFTVNAFRNDALTVGAEEGRHRFWRGTSVASLPAGGRATFPQILGYEWDEDVDNGFRPAGLMRLSSSTYSVNRKLIDVGRTYVPGVATHHLTLYRHPGGALVFGAGTMQWPWGLDSSRNNGTGLPADPRLQQATVNLLADMGVQPASLRAGLSPAEPSSDGAVPASSIEAPPAGARVPRGKTITISGAASDAGGVVAAVEVSVDGGATWRPVQGRGPWRLRWTPRAEGDIVIKSRAVDDTGNLGAPSAGVPLTVTAEADPDPVLSGLSPDGATAGDAGFVLSISGANFVDGAAVRWNGAARPTRRLDAARLEADISASDVAAAGTASVTVSHPGGALSNALSFEVRRPDDPAPRLSALVPADAEAGGPGFTLTLRGAGFNPDAKARWNGALRPTTFVSAEELRAEIPASDVAARGPASVDVLSPGGASEARVFTVRLVPSLLRLDPPSGAAGGRPFSLSVHGARFAADSEVRWNGAARPTAFVSAALLRVSVGAEDVASPGTAEVRVFTPDPGGLSNPLPWSIGPCVEACGEIKAEALSAPGPHPNPWRAGRGGGSVVFRSAAADFEVSIFTLSGRPVKRLDGGGGSAAWDLNDQEGLPVAGGFYLYRIQDDRSGAVQGTLAVIRE